MKLKALYLTVLIVEVLAACVFFFGIWQHDIICAGPVWSYGWCHPNGRFADDYFQCWLWKTTIGNGYDETLFCEFVAYWMAILALVSLTTVQYLRIRELEKLLSSKRN